MARVAAIMACYNRREKTLSCLRALHASAERSGVAVDVFLCDDGSQDGTVEAVVEQFPESQVVRGSELYWAAGMEKAETLYRSMPTSADWLLWINDDVILDPAAIGKLISLSSQNEAQIIVGATRDTQEGLLNYSGLRRAGLHPLKFRKVIPMARPQKIDTFNGNIVLIPEKHALKLEKIDGGFSHAFADIDYGMRAKSIGIGSLLHPEILGECESNPPPTAGTILSEWSSFTDIKGGGHSASITRYLRRHGGRLWALYYIATYVLWWTRAIRSHSRRSVRDRKTQPKSGTLA